jgi:peptidoglycan/LPS O-acetylase OafA/YrhL
MTSGATPEPGEARVHALDGLRGAAALSVFFFHAVPLVPGAETIQSWIDASPLGPLCNGPGAVHVFFVLSGYVLAQALDRRGVELGRYYVRRVFRIHPPYMAAVLLAWCASRLLPGATADPSLQWPAVPASRLPLALAFPSMAFGLLPAGWSLYVELAMSVLFPFLFVAARRTHPFTAIALSFLFLGDLDRRLIFLRYMIDFAIGLALWLGRDGVRRGLAALPPVAPAVTFFLGLAALQVPMLMPQLGQASPASVATFAAGAGLILVGVLHWEPARNALSGRFARYLGRVSYSFYLVHLTVLSAVMFTLGRSESVAGAVALIVGILAITFVLAEIGFRAVEQPAIRAGQAVIRAGTSLFAATGHGESAR